MNDSFLGYFKCPERYARLVTEGPLSTKKRFFRLGPGNVCYGRLYGPDSAADAGAIPDIDHEVRAECGSVILPFDVKEVVENLQLEQYPSAAQDEKSTTQAALSAMYYFVRPLLPLGLRKHLQRIHLRGWDHISFPRWPVDRAVNNLLEHLMILSIRAQELERIPFIWFWPEGASSSAIMTHDVETALGRDLCCTLYGYR